MHPVTAKIIGGDIADDAVLARVRSKLLAVAAANRLRDAPGRAAPTGSLAQRLGLAPTGSARAYAPTDEPLVRMRNTVILPGTRKLADMIAEVDDGYFLMKTMNGQADSTTEFMFGINLAYDVAHAHFAAGGINSVVGSGTLVSFPVLLAVGLPPVTATISNSLGLIAGNLVYNSVASGILINSPGTGSTPDITNNTIVEPTANAVSVKVSCRRDQNQEVAEVLWSRAPSR